MRLLNQVFVRMNNLYKLRNVILVEKIDIPRSLYSMFFYKIWESNFLLKMTHSKCESCIEPEGV